MSITADELRLIVEGAPKTTPTAVRDALVRAAVALEQSNCDTSPAATDAEAIERWKHFAANAAMTLEHAAGLRIGQMDSHSRVDEVHAQIRSALVTVAKQCREML